MPAPIWPPGLPQSPLVASFQETLPAVALRSPMDTGPAKSRRRFTTGPTPVQLSFYMTRAQVAIFKEFHDQTCEGGALWFEWTNHRDKSAALYRFTDEPTMTPKAASDGDGKVWQVSFPAEFVPLPDEPDPGNPGGDAPSIEPPPMTESIEDPPLAPTLLELVPDPNSGWPDPPAVSPVGGAVSSIDNPDAVSPTQPELPQVAETPGGPQTPSATPSPGVPISVSIEGAGAGASGAGWSGW